MGENGTSMCTVADKSNWCGEKLTTGWVPVNSKLPVEIACERQTTSYSTLHFPCEGLPLSDSVTAGSSGYRLGMCGTSEVAFCKRRVSGLAPSGGLCTYTHTRAGQIEATSDLNAEIPGSHVENCFICARLDGPYLAHWSR